MKLYMFKSYDDFELKVCEDENEAEKVFEQINGYKVDNCFNTIYEIKEVDGFSIIVIEDIGKIPKKSRIE